MADTLPTRDTSRLERGLEEVSRLFGFILLPWTAILGSLLVLYYAIHSQFGWAFGAFFTLVLIQLVAGLVRYREVERLAISGPGFSLQVEMKKQEVKSRVQADVDRRLEELQVEEKLERLPEPVRRDVAELKSVIVNAASASAVDAFYQGLLTELYRETERRGAMSRFFGTPYDPAAERQLARTLQDWEDIRDGRRRTDPSSGSAHSS